MNEIEIVGHAIYKKLVESDRKFGFGCDHFRLKVEVLIKFRF